MPVAGQGVQAQEWWLGGLHVRQTWPRTEGAGITVAVLGTGVDSRHPDLAGSVTTGPDYTGSGRTAGGPFWGVNGTAVAAAIAAHGHGTGRADGLLGVAPDAKILSIRVTLEFNDPLNSDQAIARRLPGAIAHGIVYAVDHGARVIALPLDPGTAGLTGQGNPAAAGGSPAERAAVAYALRRNVVLVAPAGDDGQGPGLVDYPAAYRGVIAVGAVSRNGRVAPFSSRHSYVSLAAPGVGLAAAVPPDGYARISSTSTSSGIVAGVAALILSRFPHLTAAQVGQALTRSTTRASTAAPGAGHGIIDAARAVGLATSISVAAEPTPPATPAAATPSPNQPERPSTTAAHGASASNLAGSLVRYVVAGLCVLIVLLVGLLLVMRRRRERSRAAAAEAGPGRTRARGQHEQRRPELVPEPVTGPAGQQAQSGRPARLGRLGRPGPLPAAGRAAAAWARCSLPRPSRSARPWPRRRSRPGRRPGRPRPPRDRPGRPHRRPSARSGRCRRCRTARSRRVRVPASGCPVTWRTCPPCRPAPCCPRRSISARRRTRTSRRGPRPTVSTARSGRTCRPGRASVSPRPRSRSTTRHRRPLTSPSRPARPAWSSAPNGVPKTPRSPARAESPAAGHVTAEPGYIWDLAATDVFPAAGDPGPQTEAPGAVPGDGDPGAS